MGDDEEMAKANQISTALADDVETPGFAQLWYLTAKATCVLISKVNVLLLIPHLTSVS
jgi:hypothetical protein